MKSKVAKLRRAAFSLMVGMSVLLAGCAGETPPPTPPAPAPEVAAAAPAAVPSTLEANYETWTPEAMEDLLAPVALYPDDVLGEVFVASTNPQEVLDAGNWRLKNDSLEGNALDDAAKEAGFTPPVRMLLQNPIVLDMMCSEFGWTQEIGQAYVNDQAGVLDAVQRLRFQARDAGTLVTSDKMVVDTEVYGGEQAIMLSSPDPEVIYVPQYDPELAYAPAETNSGHSTGTVVATALLAFGAGLVVSKIFDDDDDDWYDDDYYAPRYYGAPMPYYSHYPYRPVYGGGYYATNTYVRPPTYRYAYTNTTIVRRDVDNYWVRYDDRSFTRRDVGTVRSPITRARPNRPELVKLNDQAKRGPKRRGPNKAEREAYTAEKRDRQAEKRDLQAEKRDRQDRGKGSGKGADGRRANDVDRDRPGKSGDGKRVGPGGGADRARPTGGGRGGGDKGGANRGGANRGGGNKGGGGGGGRRPRG